MAIFYTMPNSQIATVNEYAAKQVRIGTSAVKDETKKARCLV